MATDAGRKRPSGEALERAWRLEVALGGRSNYWLAKALNVQRSTVSRWLSGERSYAPKYIELSELLGVDPTWFLRGGAFLREGVPAPKYEPVRERTLRFDPFDLVRLVMREPDRWTLADVETFAATRAEQWRGSKDELAALLDEIRKQRS